MARPSPLTRRDPPAPVAWWESRLERVLAGHSPVDDGGPGRHAAVLITLFDRHDEAHLLLTKRALHLPSHPGQISLPGGMHEPQDPSLMHTALRETQEEVGLSPERLRVLGRLGEVNTIASGFLVRPYVAVTHDDIAPGASGGEVSGLNLVPVRRVLDIDAGLPESAGIAALRYPIDGEDVWGATARILRLFCRVARDA
ncbi:MAG: CoA pyrophosphatase [Miltoncostaeaceae bacterium]